ncbi:hypothetical protein [Clostridium taeniosporum]|uniref:hypothetical protein n=1 Tax=Clostridium taeniosporum TaxID=394958 RepID=UPI00131502A7|nr:hypothetical protein [Clostridium taeniosporum]
MYLVVMQCFAENLDIPCVVTETEGKAKEWIKEEMEGRKYTGGVNQIKLIPLYE